MLNKNITSLEDFFQYFLKEDWKLLKECGDIKDDKFLMYQFIE